MKAKLHSVLASDSTSLHRDSALSVDGDICGLGIVERRASLRIPLISRLPVAAFSCNLEGAVVSYNEAAAELWGCVPKPAEIGKWSGALAMFELDGKPVPRSSFPAARAIACGRDLESEQLWLMRPDGSRRRVDVHSKIVLGPQNVIVGVLCILMDNTERQRQADELARSDEDRNAFLTLLAHELRNPLSPILSAAAIMKKVSNDERICKMAEVVERQVKILSRFVNDLLDARNLAKDGITLRIVPASLSGVIESALDALDAKAQSRGQSVVLDTPKCDEAVLCDPERVSQALANVLLNASEFTACGGRISLCVKVNAELVEADVEDTGIGISAEHISQIFQPYAQFTNLDDRMRSGVGLGLAIAKDICERHGGMITASSAGLGKGSRFRIILPIAAVSS